MFPDDCRSFNYVIFWRTVLLQWSNSLATGELAPPVGYVNKPTPNNNSGGCKQAFAFSFVNFLVTLLKLALHLDVTPLIALVTCTMETCVEGEKNHTVHVLENWIDINLPNNINGWFKLRCFGRYFFFSLRFVHVCVWVVKAWVWRCPSAWLTLLH